MIEAFHRTRRRLGFDRNELRRDVDRVQRSAGLALSLLFVTVGTLVGFLAAVPVHEDGLRAERRERAFRHQVVATALPRTAIPGGEDRIVRHTVPVRWTEPDGTTRTAASVPWAAARPGDTRRLWVNAAGRPTTPPRTRPRTVFATAAAATGGALASGLLLLIAYMLVRQHCDRLRAAEWDAAWAGLDTRRII